MSTDTNNDTIQWKNWRLVLNTSEAFPHTFKNLICQSHTNYFEEKTTPEEKIHYSVTNERGSKVFPEVVFHYEHLNFDYISAKSESFNSELFVNNKKEDTNTVNSKEDINKCVLNTRFLSRFFFRNMPLPFPLQLSPPYLKSKGFDKFNFIS